MTIQELISNRREFVDAQTKNGFDLTTVLVGLYSDASHFVYEILQNAEDAKATEIAFDLREDALVINHNGTHFTYDDINAITGISNLENDKKKYLDKIGKFGIGFKSVYAVTESPRIQSGIYDFQIIDFVLPDRFSENNNYKDTTITLNFKNKKLSNTDIYKLIESKFETFEFYNLLFLSNLNSIALKWNDSKVVFSKNEKAVAGTDLAFKTTLSVNKEKHQYIVFKTSVASREFSKLKNKPNIAIAFKQDFIDGNLQIVKADTSNLFAFFETGYETFLNFLIQAPFSTTPARDNIDFKLRVNIELLDELGRLMKRALLHFAQNKLITIDLLNHLPLNYKIEDTKIVYWIFFKAVKEEFLEGGRYLPTMFKNNYQAPHDLCIVRGRELTSLISSVADLQLLFEKKYWMDTKITADKTPELYNYLTNQLNIKEYTPEDFARKTTDDFFISKSDSWMMKFYEFLNGKQESLWRNGNKKDQGVLRQKSIIRLNNGQHSLPFDSNDKPIVFLPFKKQNLEYYNTVSPKVLQSKGAMGFIKDKLGIREPNLFDNIKNHIIPLYRTNKVAISPKKHLEHFTLILEVFSKSSDNFKDEIVELLRDREIKFIHSLNSFSNEKSYQNYQDVYLPSEMLKQYFSLTEDIYFINTGIYEDIDKELLHSFLQKCNVKSYPWLVVHPLSLSANQKEKLRIIQSKDHRITEWHGEKIIDHKLEGLEGIISQDKLSKEDSKVIWNVLLSYLNSESDKKLFKSEYSWTYRYYYTAKFRSSILKTLQETNWLFANDSDIPKKPREILLKDLDSGYEQKSDESLLLIENLKFQSEAEQILLGQLPPDRKALFSQFEAIERLCHEKGIDLTAALNELSKGSNREAEKKELENAPEIHDVETIEEDFVPLDDSGIEGKEVNRSCEEENNNNSQEPPKSPSRNQQSQQMKDEIGTRGEYLAMKHLKKIWSRKASFINETENVLTFENANNEIINISLLNSESKKGIGCDIIIRNGEEEIEYIEVKSTKMEDKDLFPVNGYQWSLAYKKFKLGQGEKFSFLIVKNVLSQKSKITIVNNPIKKWKDGELRAHPINLEF